jgi:hypothetical protein
LFDKGKRRKTYADKEVVTTSILRVRPARLRNGFAACVILKGGGGMKHGGRVFTALLFILARHIHENRRKKSVKYMIF